MNPLLPCDGASLVFELACWWRDVHTAFYYRAILNYVFLRFTFFFTELLID